MEGASLKAALSSKCKLIALTVCILSYLPRVCYSFVSSAREQLSVFSLSPKTDLCSNRKFWPRLKRHYYLLSQLIVETAVPVWPHPNRELRHHFENWPCQVKFFVNLVLSKVSFTKYSSYNLTSDQSYKHSKIIIYNSWFIQWSLSVL